MRWANMGPSAIDEPGTPTQATAVRRNASAKRRRKVRQVALSDWTNPSNPTEPEAGDDDEEDDLPDIDVGSLKSSRSKIAQIHQAQHPDQVDHVEHGERDEDPCCPTKSRCRVGQRGGSVQAHLVSRVAVVPDHHGEVRNTHDHPIERSRRAEQPHDLVGQPCDTAGERLDSLLLEPEKSRERQDREEAEAKEESNDIPVRTDSSGQPTDGSSDGHPSD